MKPERIGIIRARWQRLSNFSRQAVQEKIKTGEMHEQ